MNTLKYIIFGLMVLFTTGCNTDEKTSDSESDHHDHEEESHNEEQVQISPKQIEVMDIQLGKFQEINLSTTVKSNGRLELPPQNKASLSAIYGGRVSTVKVIEGQEVKKGEVLAYLENPEFIKIQREYIQGKSKLELLEKEFQRKKTLFEDNITSEKNYQKAESGYRQARSMMQASKAKLDMLGISSQYIEKNGILSTVPVKSPIAGFVRLVEVNIGMYVEPRDEMFEIVDNKHIHIDLMVYEKDIQKVKVGQSVVFSLSSVPERVFEAKVFAIGKAFEDDPKALKVHAEITDHNTEVLPGMYVDARIITDSKKVSAVPNDAIVTESGLSYIFVLADEESGTHDHEEHHDKDEGHSHDQGKLTFQKIEINTGESDIGFTEVVPAQNIPKDPVVVTKGAFYLLAEMSKGEHGHSH